MALDDILRHKRAEVGERKGEHPESTFGALEPSDRSLEEALRHKPTGFILEHKRASPSRGPIRPGSEPGQVARIYAPYADAVSVLTDHRFFGGSQEHLGVVRDVVSVPVLCKDFVVDPYQVAEARHNGADAILLMLSVLDDAGFGACFNRATELGMDALVEVHDEREIDRALELGARIIGINNRNLRTLEIDLSVTERLAGRVPADIVVVCESGIGSHHDVVRLREHADAFLVGSALMASPSIDRACRQLIFGEVKICGLTREQDARAAYRAGATFGGLIFAPSSPRQVNEDVALTVSKAAHLSWVGVFVNEQPKRVADLAAKLKLAAVQLHGNEGNSTIAELRSLLPPGCEIWKALPVREQLPDLDGYEADRFLLDTYSSRGSGGTGRSFDWSVIDRITDRQRIVLAGGLSPTNIGRADRLSVGVLDVSSGVENEPGLKSDTLLEQLFEALRGQGREPNAETSETLP